MNYLLISGVFAVLGLAMFSSAAMAKEQTAIFGGGCFWCMEKPFEELEVSIKNLTTDILV